LQSARSTVTQHEQDALRLAELTQRVDALSSDLAKRIQGTDQLQRLLAEREAMLTHLQELATAAEQASQQVPELTDRNSVLEKEVSALQLKLAALEETTNRAAQAETELGGLRQRLSEADAERQRLAEQLQTASSIVTQHEQSAVRLAELTRTNEELIARLSVAEAELDQARERVAATRGEALEGLQAELTNARKELGKTENMKARLAELTRENAELDNELEARGEELEQLQVELTKAREELGKTEDAKARLAELTRENVELADELEEVRRAAAETHQRFAEQVAEEMKKLRHDSAANLTQTSPVVESKSRPRPLRALTTIPGMPFAPSRRGALGLILLALAASSVTVLVVILVLSRR
jgi:chromosome segregation ATPase